MPVPKENYTRPQQPRQSTPTEHLTTVFQSQRLDTTRHTSNQSLTNKAVAPDNLPESPYTSDHQKTLTTAPTAIGTLGHHRSRIATLPGSPCPEHQCPRIHHMFGYVPPTNETVHHIPTADQFTRGQVVQRKPNTTHDFQITILPLISLPYKA